MLSRVVKWLIGSENKERLTEGKEPPTEAEAADSSPFSSSRSLRPPDFYIPEKLLLRALSGLQDEDLRKFKDKLCSFSPSLRVSWAQVEAADVPELRDLLLCNYGRDDALRKAGRALINIGRERQGELLSLPTTKLWTWSCVQYALESLDADDLERFKEELRHSRSRILVSVSEKQLKVIKNVPQLCSLLLEQCDCYGAWKLSVDVLEAINRSQEAYWLGLGKWDQDPLGFLQHALDTLDEKNLHKFMSLLGEACDQKEADSVSKGQVEGGGLRKLFDVKHPADAGEFSRCLIACYGEVEALEMAADVLEAIDQKRQAGWLRLCVESPNPWKYLEDILVDLRKEELQELKRCLFSSHSSLPIYLRTADVSKLCYLLHKFCGKFVALDVASEILEAIGQKYQADWLRLAIVGFSPRKCLDCVLQRLGQENLETIKRKLRDRQSQKGFVFDSSFIPKALKLFDFLVQSDASELSRCIINFYGEDEALEVVTEVLEAMNEKREAAWLRMYMEERDAWKCLEDAFSGLGEEDLERFRCKVLQQSEYQGLPPVPKAWKEGTTILQLIKVMFSFYGQSAALELMRRALKTMATRLSSSTMTDLYQRLDRVSGSAELQLESFVSSGEKMSGKMEKPANLEGNYVCNRCPSEDLPERERPEVVVHPKGYQERYRLCCLRAGSFHCCYTDLIFEVREAVTITYQFDSWEKHLSPMDIQNTMIAGPLFNIQADPIEAVAAVHFPHFLCLTGEEKSHLYVAHFLDEGMSLEKPDSVESFHAVLKNPTFSLFGTILRMLGLQQNIMVHAVVLLYQLLEIPVPEFHLYLLPRDKSVTMAVDKHELKCRSQRVQKPPQVCRPLRIGSRFFMVDIPSVEISPKELELEVDAKIEHPYLELFAPCMEEYMEVDLVEKESNESVWKNNVRRAELKLPASHSEPDVIPPPDLHFIECHRTELIQRVASVNQVLDMLVNVVIDAEQYDQISSKETSQKKMRELYDLVPKWNDRCKDVLYRALKETNRFLIADLEEKDNLRNLASLTL